MARRHESGGFPHVPSNINHSIISIQVVSPPYFKYSLPETGIEPLAPQHVITIIVSPIAVIIQFHYV